MKKFFRWIGIALGGLIGLTLLAGLVLYPIGMKKLTRTYPNIAVESVNIPTDADAIARGKHVSVIWACAKCHGEDLSGKLLTNDPVEGSIPTFGAIPAPNLTSGKGGIGQSYTDTDWSAQFDMASRQTIKRKSTCTFQLSAIRIWEI